MTRARRYAKYRAEVSRLTNQNRPNVPYSFTVDHVVPVSYGFRHGIPPSYIASAENLVAMHFQENIAKGAQITDDACRLLRKWGFGYLADAAIARRVA